MQITLSKKECTTIVAALKAWSDPVTFMNNGMSKEMFKDYTELHTEEMDFLIRRLKSCLNTNGGDRYPSKP